MNRNLALAIGAAVAAGVLLHFGSSLEPQWWAAWLAPIPLLFAAYRSPRNLEAFLLGALTGFLGSVGLAPYAAIYTGWAWTVVIVALQTLAWGFVTLQSRRAMRKWAPGLAVFAFPCLWAALDLLITVFSPEGNSGSYAHNQVRALPVIQIGSVLGNPGIVFVVALGASVVAAVLHEYLPGRPRHRGRAPSSAWNFVAPLLLLVLALGWGWRRARQHAPASPIIAGLLAVNNDGIHWDAPDHGLSSADGAWFTYEQWIPAMARAGVKLVVLPEKMAPIESAAVSGAQDRLGTLARQNGIYLEVGVAVHYPTYWENRAWLFTPTGRLTADYLKQHPVPRVESDYHAGNLFVVSAVQGVPVGLAICKDLDFPTLARRYGQLGIDVLLHPAWDAGEDGWWRTQTAIVAGVENGYTVIHDSREGWLTISDRYGHVIGATPSESAHVAYIADRVPAGGGPTPYARYGDWFGWICALCGLMFVRFSGDAKPGRFKK